jgi:hypothetical protein
MGLYDRNGNPVELLTEDGAIARRIREIQPTHIATAFIGRDWAQYVDAQHIRSIVISPTIGSSAQAIWDLAKVMGGFGRIHFLDALHAKYYWTPKAAVLGSSNLSNNGLQGSGGLIEAAVAMNVQEHAEQLRDLKNMHDRLVKRARTDYPTEAAKRKQLQWLTEIQHQASLIEGFPPLGTSRAKLKSSGIRLEDYDPKWKRERIHIIGFDRELNQKQEEIAEQLPLETNCVQEHAFANYTSIDEQDDVRVGDWVLQWRTKKDTWEPRVNGWIDWIYVDFILPAVSTDEGCERVAREGRRRRADEVPFVIDDPLRQAFRRLIVQKVGEGLCPEDFTVAKTDKAVPRFLRALQRELRRVR